MRLDYTVRNVALLCTLTLLAVCFGSLHGQTPVTWTGAAGNGSYADPNNWDPNVAVPLNADGNTYSVTITPSGTVNYDVDDPGEVTDLILGSSTTLNMESGRTLDVLDDAAIHGYIYADNATFRAETAKARFEGNKARLAVAGGGHIGVFGTTYDSRGWNAEYGNYTILSASGPGSVLDLSALTSLNAGFNDYRAGSTYQNIIATGGGHIDFSSLDSIVGAARGEDELYVRIVDGGTMDLSSLRTVTSNVTFVVERDTFSLPSLEQATGTTFSLTDLGSGTTLDLPKMTNFASGSISVPVTGELLAPNCATFSGNLTLAAQADANLAELQTYSSGTLSIGQDATVHAPKLVNFTSAIYTALPGRTLNAPGFLNIDNSRLAAAGGATFAVAAATYSSTGLNSEWGDYTLFSASDACSLLDLSSLTSVYARFDDSRGGVTRQRITASGGGRIDLSNASEITGPYRGEDVLHITMTGGGVIDLSGLAETKGGNISMSVSDIPGGTYSLPQLIRLRNTSVTGGAGMTLDMPMLTTVSGGGITLSAAGKLEAPALTSLGGSLTVGADGEANMPALASFSGGTLSIGQKATVNAPNLTSFTTAIYTAMSGRTLNAPAFLNIDNSRLAAAGGATFAVDANTYSSTGLNSEYGDYTLLSAADTGSVLDLSSLTSVYACFNDARNGVTQQRIVASSGGRIDLSNVSAITGPARGEDRLYITMTGGGVIDLSGLVETMGGRTEMSIADVPGHAYSMPALTRLRDMNISVGTDISLGMPALKTASGSSLTLSPEADANLASLESFYNATLTIGPNATVYAPQLTSFTYSSYTALPDRTLDAPAFLNTDNSRLAAAGGATFVIDANTYSSTGLNAEYGNYTLFSASDACSLLDLSSLTSLNAGFNDGRNGVTRQWITASAGGRIDLSNVSALTGPARSEDRLYISADGNSVIDLSSLQTVSSAGNVYFSVGGQSRMLFGDLTVSTHMILSLTDSRSKLDVAGSLLLDSTSSLTATAGAGITVGEDLTFNYTSEGSLNLDQAILHMDGSGMQYLEIGGLNNGKPDPNDLVTGNFAIGQLIIGAEGEPTVVQLTDVTNNGNRGADEAPEALYLNGLGGPDGLIIDGNSTLILDNLLVYTTENNQWVCLNELFGPGEVRIGYSDGFLELPEPCTIALLALGALAVLRRRRR